MIICQGDYKGCKGRVKDVKGSRVRIELESQGNYVEGKFPFSGIQFFSEPPLHHSVRLMVNLGFCSCSSHISETPVHPPLHMIPMRDSGGGMLFRIVHLLFPLLLSS